MANAGNINVNLTANPAGWVTGFNAAAKAAQGLVSATTVVSTTIGVTLGNALTNVLGRLASFVASTVEMGRQARIQEAAFKAMASSVGQNAEMISKKVSAAADNMIDLTASYSTMGRLLAQGFDTSQMERLAQVSKSLSTLMGTDVTSAFGRLGEAVLSGNVRMLRQVGIYVDAERAMDLYAQKLGVTSAALDETGRSQAIYAAMMEKAQKTHETLAGSQDAGIESAKRFAVTWTDMRERIGKAADTIRTEFIQVMTTHWPQIEKLITSTTTLFIKMGQSILQIAVDVGPVVVKIMSFLQGALDFYSRLPAWMQAVGIIGGVMLGPKWAFVATVVIGGIQAISQGISDLASKVMGLDVTPLENLIALAAESARLLDMKGKGPVQLPGLGAPGGGLRPDVAAIDRVNLAMQDANHQLAIGKITMDEFRLKIMTAVESLKPLRGEWKNVEDRARELEQQLVSLGETALKTNLTKNLHDLQQVLKIDPTTISGMRQTREELQLFLDVALKQPQTQGMEDFVRDLQTRIRTLDTDIRTATGALMEQDIALAEEGRAATSAAAQLESLNAVHKTGQILLEEYLDRLIALRDRMLAMGSAGSTASDGLEAVNAKIKETRDSLAGLTEQLPGATEAMRALAIPGRRPEDIAIAVSKEGISAEMQRLRQYISDREDFLKSTIPKTEQDLIDAQLQIQAAGYQLKHLQQVTANDKLHQLRLADLDREIALTQSRVNAHADVNNKIHQLGLLQAQEQGDLWKGIGHTIALELNRIPTVFESLVQATRTAFTAMHTAVEESFFQLLKGNLDDFDDIWKAFLASLLRELAAFLASAVVKGFVGFLASIFNLGGGGGGFNIGSLFGGGSAPGGGGAAAGVASQVGVTGLTGGAPGVTLGPIGVTTSGVTVFGSQVYGWGTGWGAGATQLAGPGHASFPAMQALSTGATGGGALAAEFTGVGSAGLGAEALFPSGAALGAQGGATGTATGATIAGAPALAGIAAIAAPLVVAAIGFYASMKNKETFSSRRLADITSGMGAFQTSLMAGNVSPGLLQLGVQSQQEFQAGFLAPGANPRGDRGVGDLLRSDQITNPATLERLQQMYGADAPQIQAMIEQNAMAIREAFAMQTAAVLGGQAVGLPAMLQQSGGAMEGSGQVTDVSNQFKGESVAILGQLEGFSSLAPSVADSLTNLMASFEGNKGAIVELVKSVSEQLPAGLKLSTEEAARLVEQGLAANVEFMKSADAVAALSAQLLDTTNGVGNMAQEASIFVEQLASGTIPAEQLQGLFSALANEHGPGFTAALQAAVIQLGLSKEQAAEILGIIAQMAEGVVVPVNYEISVSGEPPPGASSPGASSSGGGNRGGGGGGGGREPLPPPGAPEGLQHGGIVTRPTFTMVGEAGPEAVLPLTQQVFAAFGESVAEALGAGRRGQSRGEHLDPDLEAKFDALIALTRQTNELLRRSGGGGRLTGARV